MHALNSRLDHMLKSIGFEYTITDDLIQALIKDGLEFKTNDDSILHVTLKEGEICIKGEAFKIRESKMKRPYNTELQQQLTSAEMDLIGDLHTPILDSALFQHAEHDKYADGVAPVAHDNEQSVPSKSAKESFLARIRRLIKGK